MRVLIVEQDPVFAALLEDRLTVAGHSAQVLSDATAAVRQAEAGAADLILLSMAPPFASGKALLAALRSQPETRSVPVLVLAERDDSHERLALLRAGADDYLARPCELAEITLRVERLLGGREATAVALQGDLANQSMWEVLQVVTAADQTGYLVLRGALGSGRLQVVGGRVLAARWQELEGTEALLAIAGTKKGRFRFITREGAEAPAGAEPLPVSQTLLEAAWLEDELAKRRHHLPPTGAPLKAKAAPPKAQGPAAELPVAAIYRRVADGDDLRLYDLINTDPPAAPLKVRLAVAWLVEKGALQAVEPAPGVAYPDTTEISSSVLLEVAARDLLAAARAAGVGGSVVPYLLLVAPGVWDDLLALLRAAPDAAAAAGLGELARHLSTHASASTTLATDLGRLSLHVHRITTPVPPQLETVATVCAGVVLWSDEAPSLTALAGLARRITESPGAVLSVVVATTPEAQEAAASLIGEDAGWRLSPEPPRSLLGLLRLLRPQPGARPA